MTPLPLPQELVLVIHNRTLQPVACSLGRDAEAVAPVQLSASSSSEFRLEKRTSPGALTLSLLSPLALKIVLPSQLFKKRCGRACRTRRLTPVNVGVAAFALYNAYDKALDVLLIEEPDRASWMSLLPSDHSLADFCVPGTHETLAQFGFPASSCQSTQSVKASQSSSRRKELVFHVPQLQLQRGCRFLDLRFALNDKGVLRAYHGVQNQYILASEVFEELYSFLDKHPSETVICSIKQENRVKEFQAAMLAQIDKRLDLWYLENRFPTLGEVRGKCILFSRFGRDAKLGIHPSSWPNNSVDAFEWQLENITVRTQDWYDIGSYLRVPEKASKVIQLLDGPRPPATWRLDFASAASLAYGAFPCNVAKGMLGIRGVNARLVDWLVARAASGVPLEGCTVLMDYFEYPDDMLVTLLIGFNFDRSLAKTEKGG